jgi:lysophospholipase L1-like esterase
VATYAEVVGRIRKEVPDAKIFIVSCTPTRDAYAYISPLIPKFNAEIAKLANGQDPAIYYVDTYSECVAPDGLLRKELSRDGLHLNAAGYEIVRTRFLEAMAKAKLMPDHP